MMSWQIQAAWLRRAMAAQAAVTLADLLLPRDVDGQIARQMAAPPHVVPRRAAALILLFPQDDHLHLPLTLRTSHLPTHRGQVSLPGGAIDPGDASAEAAALREAHEELGIDPGMVEVLGCLSSFYIPPSNFMLTPVVGLCAQAPTLQPHPGEVELAFTVALDQLLDPATVVVEEWQMQGVPVRVPYFALAGQKVWGATAIALSELVARLRRVPG
ncbi:NUDIX hydrolase [Candidatus Oscillochloris fontis]|uniref:NUDIX hydrolase n=1 Tax=Candidatus Oscillochloris fontis TaxID=2496868 RepID=UPI00101B7E84|nr:CoA pyrophosphatase [Candidatus Oscillochloris fontis]